VTTSFHLRSIRQSVAVTLVGVLGAVSIFASSAGAVGNSTLSAELVRPVDAHWQPYSTATVQHLVNIFTANENSSIAPLHGRATVATQLWHRARGLNLQITLTAITSTKNPNKNLYAHVKSSALTSAIPFCNGTVHMAPKQTGRIPSIPNSVVGECPLVNGNIFVIVSWVKANVWAVITTSIAAESLTNVVALSIRQYHAMSASDFQIAGSGSPSTPLIVGVIVVAVALLGVGAYAATSSRRRSAGLRGDEDASKDVATKAHETATDETPEVSNET
jgi:hypothetical protein